MLEYFKKLFDSQKPPAPVDITRRFELLNPVGQGTMSQVWRARDSQTHRVIALKILDLEKTNRLEARFQGLAERKPSEGEIAIKFQHPHIVRTLEHGLTTKGEQFLVMEFVEGIGLSALIDSQNEVMKRHRPQFMLDLAEAMAYFHKQGFIHRDLCPRNLMVDHAQRIMLLDFGLAVPNTPAFQAPGNRTGTANYMAPELAKRQKTDQRIDIFSYAVTCYEMWTGSVPWEAEKSIKSVTNAINTPPPPIRDGAPDIDLPTANLIMKGLSLRPEDRWQSMAEIAAKLREIQGKTG